MGYLNLVAINALLLCAFPIQGSAVELVPEETLCDFESTCATEGFDLISLSEAYGHFIGQHLIGADLPLDPEAAVRGVRLAVAGFPSPLSAEEFNRALDLLREEVVHKSGLRNLEQAEHFLRANSERTGVQELVPGKLQMRVDVTGDGAEVTPLDVPLIYYRCHYLDGALFGSSEDPVSLPLDQTILGFRLGIVGMREGEHRTLFVHPELGYGMADRHQPNSLLILEVELIKATCALSEKDETLCDVSNSSAPTQDTAEHG